RQREYQMSRPGDGISILQAEEPTKKEDRHEHTNRTEVHIAFCHVPHWDFGIPPPLLGESQSCVVLSIHHVRRKRGLIWKQETRSENMHNGCTPQRTVFKWYHCRHSVDDPAEKIGIFDSGGQTLQAFGQSRQTLI